MWHWKSNQREKHKAHQKVQAVRWRGRAVLLVVVQFHIGTMLLFLIFPLILRNQFVVYTVLVVVVQFHI